jgi:hypothetical protein
MMATSTLPLLDPAPLERQSMGDRAIRLEVLALFVAEAERLMNQVEEAGDPQVRADTSARTNPISERCAPRLRTRSPLRQTGA